MGENEIAGEVWCPRAHVMRKISVLEVSDRLGPTEVDVCRLWIQGYEKETAGSAGRRRGFISFTCGKGN